jgi:hypothetical protein
MSEPPTTMSAPPTTGVEDEFYHVTLPTTGAEGGILPCNTTYYRS